MRMLLNIFKYLSALINYQYKEKVKGKSKSNLYGYEGICYEIGLKLRMHMMH